MLRIELDSGALSERLDALPRAVSDALERKMDALSATLLDRVDANVSGGVLNTRSGALLRSLFAEVVVEETSVAARVGSDGSAPYAAIQEFGGKTAAHDIVPNKAGVLAFVVGGRRVFARRVHHRGSQIPERSYLRSALEGSADEIAGALADALRDGVEAP